MQAASPVILALTAPIALTTGPLSSLVVASVSGLTNLFWLLPWTHKVKEQRKNIAKKYTGSELEAKDAILRKEFGKSHGLSLLFNLSNVCGMLAYGVCLSGGLLKKNYQNNYFTSKYIYMQDHFFVIPLPRWR
ncbi:YPR098C-like protein [Saccharomyces cerevisiae FostersO]|nr:YPR098C-like protein [Saccharomyces cerevisiae FostersO]